MPNKTLHLQSRTLLLANIFKISTPVILSFLVTYIQVFTEQVFIGNYDTQALAAINNAVFPFYIAANICFAIGNALAILVAKYIGQGNNKKAGQLIESSYFYSCFSSLLFFILFFFGGRIILSALGSRDIILDYAAQFLRIISFNFLIYSISVPTSSAFQGMGVTLPILIGEAVRVALNVFLNWLLIFGNWGFPESGIQGAALAMVLSTTAGTVINFIILLNYKKYFTITAQGIKKADFSLYFENLKLGFPMTLEFTCINAVPVLIIFFINRVNPLYAGVYGIWNTLLWFSSYFNIGIGISAYSLIGKSIGAGQWKQAKTTSMMILLYALISSSIIASIFILFSHPISCLFSKDIFILEHTKDLSLLALLLIPMTLTFINGYSIKSYGKTIPILITQAAGMVTIPFFLHLFLNIYKTGINGILMALFLDYTLKGIVHFILLKIYAGRMLRLNTANN